MLFPAAADATEASIASGIDTEAGRSLRMVDRVEFAINFQSRRDRQFAGFKRVADGATERDHATLECAKNCAGACIGCELLIVVPDQANGELLGRKSRCRSGKAVRRIELRH
jgi:hypothetical protein